MEMSSISQPQNEGLDHEILVSVGIKPATRQASCPADQEMEHSTSIIIKFLLDKVPEYCTLAQQRREGWENPYVDRHYQEQRHRADNTNKNVSRVCIKLMQKIGQELNDATHGFETRTSPGNILDMCAAPGGFLETAMNLNPESEVVAFSLPPPDGYNFLLLEHKKVCFKYLDITMLAADMGATTIPEEHPDAANFLPRQIKETQLFDLVLCDGHVLRTHTREHYRETREPQRLKCTQLALGLEHLKPGGTMIVLFHKVESWDTVCFLRRFSEFSSVKLHKPKAGHADRSSFYMVATNVQSQQPKAHLAIDKWKEVWRAATFGTEEEFADALRKGEQKAETVLESFGSELVLKGRKVWKIQSGALAKQPYMRRGRAGTRGSRR